MFFFQNWFRDTYIADKSVCSAKYPQQIWNSSNKQNSILSLSHVSSRMSEMKSCTCWGFKLSSIDFTQYMFIFKRSSSCHQKKNAQLIKTETFISPPRVSWSIFLKFISTSLEVLNSLSLYSLLISQNLASANTWPAFGISVFQFSIFSIYLFAGKLK